ncbi:MAG: ThuA domain-containing protein, partial [Planctomycetes bacterium]|nr:ThuA domain-containing protein [Planctomycetota bacterium]
MMRAFKPGIVLVLGLACASAYGAEGKIRVQVFTGGHPFEKEKFFALFEGYPDVEYREAVYPEAAKSLGPEAAKAFDVFVMYDMFTGLDAKGKEDFARTIREGKSIVILHHAIASHQDWPEYEKILGGRFWTQPPAGETASKAGWGAPIRVRVADPDHPIVRGVPAFEAADEWYGACRISPEVQVLLETDHPENNKAIAWVHTYGQGRVAYIQLGHDDRVYSHPAYRRLIVQAIRWAAKRPVEGGAFTPLYN